MPHYDPGIQHEPYKFEQFEIIPLFDGFIEVVVDPKIVEDWPFSGWDGGDLGHTWFIKACKQEKPCTEAVAILRRQCASKTEVQP